jgi:hypothetical protein
VCLDTRRKPHGTLAGKIRIVGAVKCSRVSSYHTLNRSLYIWIRIRNIGAKKLKNVKKRTELNNVKSKSMKLNSWSLGLRTDN